MGLLADANAWGWARCPHCGVQTHAIQWHVCDKAIDTAKTLYDFKAEFEKVDGAQYPAHSADWRRFRWTPFATWLDTSQGRFEQFYTQRSKHA